MSTFGKVLHEYHTGGGSAGLKNANVRMQQTDETVQGQRIVRQSGELLKQ